MNAEYQDGSVSIRGIGIGEIGREGSRKGRGGITDGNEIEQIKHRIAFGTSSYMTKKGRRQ